MSILLAGLLAAAAPQNVVWKWVPEPNSCLLRQDVGNGLFLDVGGRPGSKEVGLSIIDTNARIREPKNLNEIQLSFSPGGTIDVKGLAWPHRDPTGRSLGTSLGREAVAQFAGASAIALTTKEYGAVRVPVRSAGAALGAIRTCEDRKLREWGVDPAALRALSAMPAPATPMDKWFSWMDYPDREKIYKNDIEVVARLDVAADGSVLKCTVVNRPPAEFVPAACNALMKNAKFHPARDIQGQPVAAPYLFQVNFAAYHL